MRILLYLPVVTPWWFSVIVEPILRRLVTVADVHVLAPIPWRNTGLGHNELVSCSDLPNVQWHIIDSDDHPSLRTAPIERDDLLAYIHALSPDIVLCRSADFATARAFPGTVRYLMEVAAAPFWIVPMVMITDQPFVNGVMPDLDAAGRARLDALIAPLWADMHAHQDQVTPDRHAVFDQLGISPDRPAFLLPLEYEHEENFFRQHRPDGIGSEQMLATIAADITPHGTLVVTDHPLNVLHVDRTALADLVSGLGDRVILAPAGVLGVSSTTALARYAAGMLVGDSKSFALAAAFGVPTMRRSSFASADWLNTYSDIPAFVDDVCRGDPRTPSAAATRTWFAYHFANEAFNPGSPALSGEEIIDRCCRTVNPARWDAGMARVLAAKPEQVH